ncbi:hypothetical protein H0H93_007114 [Arthromyces matolae]|nr:hypothetical protein H0H93_007114 [Arthromyces matolae]
MVSPIKGIPKSFCFARGAGEFNEDSERYPLTSQLIQENKIPEFVATNGTDTPNGKSEGEEADWEDVEEDEESRAAVDRVLKKYEKAHVAQDDEDGDFDARHERSVMEKMDEWKRSYYQGKLEISYDNPQQMGDLVYKYVEGLQWVMHYYYSGVASWGWFYNYHYAPRISDLRGVDKLSFEFELGKPFRPFEQLMGDLMYDPNSPILDFYPVDFELDLNGKKADWEAIVKIPFMDETRLLKAMACGFFKVLKAREHRLTPEEKARNSFGTSTKFSYSTGEPTVYPSSLPGFFPPIYRCTCRMEPFDLPTLDGLHLVKGLCDGVLTGVDALAGFPSLKTLPHTAALGFHGVNVHGSESRNKSMVVHIENPYENMKTEDVGNSIVGKRTFTGWPFLQEGLVVAVSDSLFKYEKLAVIPGAESKIVSTPHAPQGLGHWKMKAERIEQVYSKRLGVITGSVDVLLHVRPLKGLKRLEDGAFVKDYEGADKELEHAVIVENRRSSRYYPSFKAADMLGISGRALSKVTASFMVITADNQKINLGLSLKFEAKALKVIDYTRKDGRHWEYSEKAVELIRDYKATMAKASEIFESDPEARVKEIKTWLNSKGVRDFEPVSLFCDQLTKETVIEIEKLADTFTANKSSSGIKKAIVKGIPRQAVLKPAHVVYRLQNQAFALGDRVTMVQDSGGVPLSVKGVVIGLNSKSMDVVWDVPFMSGATLGDRCSMYRGSTVEFNTCLNLTNPQFIASTNPKAPPPPPNPSFHPRFGPYPAVRSAPGQPAASGFRPAPPTDKHSTGSVKIMSNPNRGRGGGVLNNRGAHHQSNSVAPDVEEQEASGSDVNGTQDVGVVEGEGFEEDAVGFNQRLTVEGGHTEADSAVVGGGEISRLHLHLLHDRDITNPRADDAPVASTSELSALPVPAAVQHVQGPSTSQSSHHSPTSTVHPLPSIQLARPTRYSDHTPEENAYSPTRETARYGNPLPPLPTGNGSEIRLPTRTRTTDTYITHHSGRPQSRLDWIVPVEEKVIPKLSVGERLQPTLTKAHLERDKYATKAKMTGYALNAAIGLQVLLGSLTTGLSGLSIANGGKSAAIATTLLGGMSTVVASYLARARGSNEPELSITRVKDLEQFIREADAFQMDHGHILTNEHDEALFNFRAKFEELLGNANGFSEIPQSQSSKSALVIQHPEIPDEPAYKVEILQPAPTPLPQSTYTTPAASQAATPRSEPIPATRILSVSEVTTMFLASLLKSAEDFLGKKVENAVITVPTAFTDAQKDALEKAANAAGVRVLQLLDEAGAAAVTTTSDIWAAELPSDRTQLIVDLGSSSLSLTLLSIRHGLAFVLGSSYTTSINADQIDDKLIKFFASEFTKKTKVPLTVCPSSGVADTRAEARFRLAIEHTKRTISASPGAATCSVESLKDGVDYTGAVNRMRFDLLVRPVYTSVASSITSLLQSAGIDAHEVDEIVYVGGSTALPGLDETLQTSVGFREDVETPFVRGTVVGGGVGDPTTILARGCAVQCALLASIPSEDQDLLAAYQRGDTNGHNHVQATSKTVGVLVPGVVAGEEDNGLGGSWVPVVYKETALPARRTVQFEVELSEETTKKLAFEVWEVTESIRVEKVQPEAVEPSSDAEDEEEEDIEVKHREVKKDNLLGVVQLEAQLGIKTKGKSKDAGKWLTTVEAQVVVHASGAVDISVSEVGEGGAKGAISVAARS